MPIAQTLFTGSRRVALGAGLALTVALTWPTSAAAVTLQRFSDWNIDYGAKGQVKGCFARKIFRSPKTYFHYDIISQDGSISREITVYSAEAPRAQPRTPTALTITFIDDGRAHTYKATGSAVKNVGLGGVHFFVNSEIEELIRRSTSVSLRFHDYSTGALSLSGGQRAVDGLRRCVSARF